MTRGFHMVGRSLQGVPDLVKGLVGRTDHVLGEGTGRKKPKGTGESAKEKDMKRKRWWYVGGMAAFFVVYVLGSGLVQFEFEDDEDEE